MSIGWAGRFCPIPQAGKRLSPLRSEGGERVATAKEKKAMLGPTQEAHGNESILPLHDSWQSKSKTPLHAKDETNEWSREAHWHHSPNTSDHSVLPSWSANPQAPGDDSLSAINTKNFAQRRQFTLPLFLIGFVLVGLGAIFTSRTTVDTAAGQVSILTKNKEEMDKKLKNAEIDIQVLNREITAMDAMILQQGLDAQSSAANGKYQRAMSELISLQKRLKSEERQANALKKQVQNVSHDEIIQKYGSGLHKVEMELFFPDEREGPTTFVIELAPSDIMPHSVYTFLEMASKGLLNGCSFILNALHVLKVAPLPYDGTSATDKAKEFAAAGLETVAFREYSEAYPHRQYTVGFAADGSPSFYINTEDNSEIHVGDPCFGKVVEGFDTVRRLEASPTRNGIWFKKRIGIKRATLLKD